MHDEGRRGGSFLNLMLTPLTSFFILEDVNSVNFSGKGFFVTTSLFTPYTLPSGMQLPNRLIKAAMEESLCTADHTPGEQCYTLYRTWAYGGVGTLITGNVMVHDAALAGPKSIVLDEDQPLAAFRRWAEVVHDEGAKIIMQINHPGRQVRESQGGVSWGPSDKSVDVGLKQVKFQPPTPMTKEQIADIIEKFVTTAKLAEAAGFDGVEVHAAHGYLISQFLSPLVNTREDEWGGSLENRARLLLEIVRGIRESVEKQFVVSVKLNSADFQRGGFDANDAMKVIEMLTPLGIDFVELSGGSYESPAMSGANKDERTLAREAYFLEFTKDIVASSSVPVMLTGGITRPEVAQKVLDSGFALVGIGTALAADPDLPRKWRTGVTDSPQIPEPKLKNKTLRSAASLQWVKWQMRRLAAGKRPKLTVDPRLALGLSLVNEVRANKRYQQWLENR